MLQEDAQEANHPVSHRLALLDAHDPQQAAHDLCIEFLLVKVFVLLFAFAALLARVGGLEAACFLDLSQVDHQLPLRGSRLLCIAKDLGNLCTECCDGAFVGDFDCVCGCAR